MPLIPDKIVEKIQHAPSTPGVYIFKNTLGIVLYIGKAINLKRRLQYYAKEEIELYPKTAQFLKQTTRLEYIDVKSDVEALLLEINLIRTLKPKYNILSKDDKRPLFIQITNDKLPRVKLARIEIHGTGTYIGPFPSGYKLSFLLKKLRHIFPFCSCSPRRKHPCMFVDLGLCPNTFSLMNPKQKSAYTRNISRLKLLLTGSVDKVIKILEKDMKTYATKLNFEKADEIKHQIDAVLSLRQQPNSITNYLSDASISHHISNSQWIAVQNLFRLDKLTKIEGYDIANTSGKLPTASMVVFENGYANTSQYRKFKINGFEGPNDPAMIYQTLIRRLNHSEWEMPQLILIDGGISQIKAAMRALKLYKLEIQLVGLAKRIEQLVIPTKSDIKVLSLAMDNPALTLLRSIRDEAHRFTTTYHKKLREDNLFNN